MGDSAQAATYAAPIFRDFMKMALADKPDTPFRVPPGIKLISVDLKSGMRSSGAGSILEAFKPGTAPPDTYGGGAPAPRRRRDSRDRPGGRLGHGRPVLSRRPAPLQRGIALSMSPSSSFEPESEFHARRSGIARRTDQAVRGTAEEASLTSRIRRAASRN